MQAFIEWNTAREREAVQARRREGRPPLETIRVLLTDWSSTSIGPDQASRVLSVYGELAADPLMREPIRTRFSLILDEIERLVRAAIEAGDLEPCDVQRVARALLAGTAGTLLIGLLTQPEAFKTLEEQIIESIDDTLARYLPERTRTRT